MYNYTFKEYFYLNEMPITGFNKIGNWQGNSKKYGYDKSDLKLLNNEKYIEKIINKWSKTNHNFALYFVRNPSAYKYIEIGEVSADWVKENLSIDIQPNPEAINIIFTNNQGANKIPLTSWMIAHRASHAIFRGFFGYNNMPAANFYDSFAKFRVFCIQTFTEMLNETLHLAYHINIENIRIMYPALRFHYLALAYAIGTMKSTNKLKKLNNHYEFFHELFAQYINNNKITFNPLPKTLIINKRKKLKSDLDDSELDDLNQNLLGQYALQLTANFDLVLHKAHGRIFVM